VKSAGTLFIGIILSAAVSATTIIPVTLERLASESSHVVEGRVVSTESKWNQQHTLIFTYTTIAITKTLKGNSQSSLVVKQIGGSAEGYTQKVAGVRYSKPGEESVFFLRPSATHDGSYEITGLMQGLFAMKKSAQGRVEVSNGVPGVSTYQRGFTGEYTGTRMSLQELERRVSKAVQQ
jgi:hypothetical protein